MLSVYFAISSTTVDHPNYVTLFNYLDCETPNNLRIALAPHVNENKKLYPFFINTNMVTRTDQEITCFLNILPFKNF